MLDDYQNFFDSLELLLFVINLEGYIIHCNTTACDRLGYTKGELIGMPVVNIHPPEQRMFAGMLVEDMLKGDAEVCPIPIQTKEGKLIDVETRVSLGSWQGEEALFGVTKDVTDLTLSNNKFTTIFRFCPIAIAITGVADGKIYEVNDAWVELTGHVREDSVGKTVYDLQLYRSDEERELLIHELENTGALKNYGIIMKVKDGSRIVGQFSAASIIINGVNCWITAMVDITDQIKLEDAITEFRNTVIRDARDGIVKLLKEGTFVK
jgi:PAS domain S-box-containing protein